jgi:hypothetical protein
MTEFNINFNKINSSTYYGMTNLSEWEVEWLTPEGHDRMDEQDHDYSIQLNWEEDFTLEGKQVMWDTLGGYWKRTLLNAGYCNPYELETEVEIKNMEAYTSLSKDIEFKTVKLDLSQSPSTFTINPGDASWVVSDVMNDFFVAQPPTISGAFTF